MNKRKTKPGKKTPSAPGHWASAPRGSALVVPDLPTSSGAVGLWRFAVGEFFRVILGLGCRV